MLALYINFAAIVVIILAFILSLRLRKQVLGGTVKTTWNILTALIAAFVIGYLLTPFFSVLNAGSKDLVVSLIFFFGAIFVIIVIYLFQKIIKDLGLS
ncbi:hypothetical protein K8S19_03395 [bacterium]|nr:hypothetical protein [bacterium]